MRYSHLLSIARSHLGLQPAFVSNSILGADLRVHEGTFPEHPDYDDAWLFALVTQSSVFFDVGSNVGQMSLLACLENPNRIVVAMDANPRALATAAENLILNGFANQARFVHAFLSDSEDGEVEFFTVSDGQAGSRFRSHAKTANAMNSSFKVKTTTLDVVSKAMNLVPDLIKIDVEGAEAEVLCGARELTNNHRPRYLVEMHALNELTMAENGARVLSWCREVGYDTYYLKNHEQVTSVDPFAGRGRCHLFLQPSGECYPDVLNGLEQGASLDKAQQALRHP